MLILLYVQHELSYDHFHEKADRIYRLTRERFWNQAGKTDSHDVRVGSLVGSLLKNDFEGIEMVRLYETRPWIRLADRKERSHGFVFADPGVFDVFTFPFISGDPKTALRDPHTVVLTETTARRYFGSRNPVGEVLILEEVGQTLKITGVIQDIPANSHIQAHFLASWQGLKSVMPPKFFEDWYASDCSVYVLIAEGTTPETLTRQFPDFVERHEGRGHSKITHLYLQSLTDIHLRSHRRGESGPIVYIYLSLAIAAIILIIACINFMNLMTARSVNRSKEVGLRKVVGANRYQLIQQFLSESILIALVALFFALLLVELALPWFNGFLGKDLKLDYTGRIDVVLGLFGLVGLVGILAGSYPALFLTAFRPEAVLKGSLETGIGGGWLRKGLVVLQFAASTVLIIATGVVYSQVAYMKDKNLGFDQDQVLVIHNVPQALLDRFDTVRHEFLQYPGIVNVCTAGRVPPLSKRFYLWGLNVSHNRQETTLKMPKDEPDGAGSSLKMPYGPVSHDFFRTFGMKMVAGRDFSSDLPTDSKQVLVLNETAVKALGFPSMEAAVGAPFRYWNRQGKIIGVVQDAHFESLRKAIQPVGFVIDPNYFEYLAVHIEGDTAQALGFLKEKWQALHPGYALEYSFVDEDFDRQYRAEEKQGEMFSLFALLAVFISCLGLLGLASYTAEQRTKEIGIRKVLGASVAGLVMMLSGGFIKLVVLANLIAWPLAYWAMRDWLTNFAYRIDLSWEVFTLSGGLTLVIALLAVSYQAWKAARSNPVDALRYE